MSHAGVHSVIVKIGGSLLRQRPPGELLTRLADRREVVLVPGGGALADAVRDAQPQLGVSDKAAHAMAILAMEQMAHALLDLAPDLTPCRALADFAAPRSSAALWFPSHMLIGAPGIPESWDVTSDSLALWLAKSLGADHLVLLKAPGARVPIGPLGPGDLAPLAATGLIDPGFEGMAHGFRGTIVVANADDSKTLEEALRTETPSKDRP